MTGRRFASYADTAAIDDATLRAAAQDGAAEDRALACWRLMTRGQALTTIGAGGPDAGHRRLLLLNFAAAREVELLEAVAQFDPEPAIRREALGWLIRVAPSPVPAMLRVRAAAAEEPELVFELVEANPRFAWDALAAELELRLSAADVATRARASDRLFELGEAVPPVLRRAVEVEANAALQRSMLSRWARSADHAALIEALTSWERGREAIVRALVEAGRSYSFEMLAPLAAAGDAGAVTELLGPPYSPAAGAWLLGQVNAALADGGEVEVLLRRFAGACSEGVVTPASDEDAALVLLLAGEEVAATLSAGLSRLLQAPHRTLRLLAARELSRHDLASSEVQAIALAELDEEMLERWARSEHHASLLAAAVGAARDAVSARLSWSEVSAAMETALSRWSAVLSALATAGRRAPWEALQPIAEVLATEHVEPFQLEDSQAVGALLCLLERPLAPAARRWLVVMEDRSRLFSGDGWAVREALESAPVGELAADELALLQLFRERVDEGW
ncbi:hypothetical protein [Nannocystis punicea]|uniref:Uncharacterized protein n=1 Tax=Nannocystis punicea TaxID=2995304 RepID=A0ABY7H0D3_9BACT|nr:hypothetical protein [Nannocystis poenicansa]WAS92597.1 hypothetical protein O0S08_40980 [Nannocystis poenicansa]